MEAFERLVSVYSDSALAVAQQILFDRSLAEDAVQDTFLKVFRLRQRYDASKPFSRWFYTILRNICIDMIRKHKRHAKAIEKIADWQETKKKKPLVDIDIESLLGTLPAGEQFVLRLRIFHDMPFREVAFAANISTEAAKKRAQRGLKKLREKVQISRTKAIENCSRDLSKSSPVFRKMSLEGSSGAY